MGGNSCIIHTEREDQNMKIANRQAREAVEGQKDFVANNIFGHNESDTLYVVYSYGHHFPMYAWVRGTGWIRNVDKYSVTTSKHQNQTRPLGVDFVEMNTEQLREVIRNHS
jgi:hypothetical protein